MATSPFRRVFVIVIDSLGVGELPDAALYGDEGSNTLGNIAAQVPLRIPNLHALGLSRIVRSRACRLPSIPVARSAAWPRCRPARTQ